MPGFLDGILHEKTKDWIFAPLAAHNTPQQAAREEIRPDADYVSIFLRSARIVNVRAGMTRFFGVVHSFVRVPHRSGEDAEFAVVTVPADMQELDPHRLDRVIQMNQRLVGPVPFIGGDLQIDVALLSVAATDLAAPYLQLLQKVSDKAGVGYIATALPFADVITSGINLLAGGMDENILEIGFSAQEDIPKTGWYVAIRARKNSIDVGNLKIDAADNKLTTTDGSSLEDYPYLVIEIKKDPVRHDWSRIPDLARAYADIQAQFRRGDSEATEDAIAAFRRVALTCNDLLEDHAVQLAARVRERYAEVGPPKPLHQRTRKDISDLPPLESLNLYGAP